MGGLLGAGWKGKLIEDEERILSFAFDFYLIFFPCRLEEGISVKREAKELLETCRKMIGWDEQAFTKVPPPPPPPPIFLFFPPFFSCILPW